MNILGISCFYHDSAAVLVKDGEIAAAAQEERFTRKKHDPRFPAQAIAWCLRSHNLTIKDIDYIAFYEKPFLKFERILETFISCAPSGLSQFLEAIPSWIKQKLWMD
jgi:carbamoyltransferase